MAKFQGLGPWLLTQSQIQERREELDIPLIVLILFSAGICVESYKLGVGTLSLPGTGFFPLLIGILLGALALVRQLRISLSRESMDKPNISGPLKRVLPFTASLFGYVYLMDKLGFVISTFLWIAIVLKLIEHKSWKIVLSLGIGIPVCTHLIFKMLLRAQLPRGLIGS